MANTTAEVFRSFLQTKPVETVPPIKVGHIKGRVPVVGRRTSAGKGDRPPAPPLAREREKAREGERVFFLKIYLQCSHPKIILLF